MSVRNMGISIGENRKLLRGVCVEKVFWHNSKQDGTGDVVGSVMVFIPRFKLDFSKFPPGVADKLPSELNGQWFGGFWVDKYQCSQPHATPTDAFPDVPQDASPGVVAARSQQGVPPWTYITFDEARLACENRGGIVTGTANDGTTTTLTDQALSASDNYYVGWRLRITAGTNAGQARKVVAFDNATHTITVDRPFTSPIDNTSQYRLTQFHLITPEEWAALAFWSLMNGTMPHGNNHSLSSETQDQANHDVDYPDEKGIPDPTLVWGDNDIWPRCLTGTGPPTWAHNHHASGVYDLNGNVWEWVDMKINDGVISEVEGDNVHPAVGKAVPSSNGYVVGISSDSELMRLAIPVIGSADPDFGQDYYWVNTAGERAALRGGYWGGGSDAGVFALSLNNAPSSSLSGVGFRASLSVI